jgi:hypothetical protein
LDDITSYKPIKRPAGKKRFWPAESYWYLESSASQIAVVYCPASKGHGCTVSDAQWYTEKERLSRSWLPGGNRMSSKMEYSDFSVLRLEILEWVRNPILLPDIKRDFS